MSASAQKAILLMNLGSPDSTAVKDVRKYLNEFLMDGRVIDIPFIARALLVRGIIVPFRAPKSAEAYKTIWTDEGSPLIVLTKQLQQSLQQKITEPVAIAMRYGNPSPKQAFDDLLKQNPDLKEVIIVPLYPHYAMSSYETAIVQAKEHHAKGNYPFSISFIKPFYKEENYLNALAASMQPRMQKEYDHILFSYHGIPERHLRKTGGSNGSSCMKINNCCEVNTAAHATCYRHQVFTTTKRVAEKLGLSNDKYSISFQSRLGKGWLEPFTDIRLEEMPKEGIKKLLIICPAFISDCLETLEEIAERGKKTFMDAGGESCEMIPCLNTDPMWVDTLVKWVEEYKEGNREMILNR